MKKDFDLYLPVEGNKISDPGINKILYWHQDRNKNIEYKCLHLCEGLYDDVPELSKGYVYLINEDFEDIVFFNIGRASIATTIYFNLINYYEER